MFTRWVKISKHGCRSFFSIQIWYISNREIVERICSPCSVDQPAYKAVELLKLSESLTFEEFTAKLVERFDSGETKEYYKMQLRARCQRPNEFFEVFADNVMALVENAKAVYSFKVELTRDQFIQGVAISNDLREKVFMSQPGSLVEAVRVVRR